MKDNLLQAKDLRIRDPFVFVDNGKYYLLGTTGDDCWVKGSDLIIYASADLESFVEIGKIVDEKTLKNYTNIWAPEIHKYNGFYYLIVSVYTQETGRGSIILKSSQVDGKYQLLTGEYVTPKGWGCLDATLFVYENKPYLIFSNEWTTPISHDGDGSLFVAELDEDLKEIISCPKKIISSKNCGFAKELEYGDGITKGTVAEGPFLFQKEKNIILLWSTYTEKGYCVVQSISKNGIYGEFKFDKFLFNEDGGHCMVFSNLQGQKILTLHQPNNSPNERLKTFQIEE